MQIAWVRNHPEATLSQHIAVNVGIYLLAIFNAWASYNIYDVPVRRWLKEKCFKKKQ